MTFLSPVEQLLREAGHCRGLLAASTAKMANRSRRQMELNSACSGLPPAPQESPVPNTKHIGCWESLATRTLPLLVAKHRPCWHQVDLLHGSLQYLSARHTAENQSLYNLLLSNLASESYQHLNHRQVKNAIVLTGVKRTLSSGN